MALPPNCIEVDAEGVCTKCADCYVLDDKGNCCPKTDDNGNTGTGNGNHDDHDDHDHHGDDKDNDDVGQGGNGHDDDSKSNHG